MFLTDNGYNFDDYTSTRYWSNKTRIEYIQRRIILFSIMYYQLNDSIVSDNQYNNISKQLVNLMSQTDKSIVKKTKYYYVFKDFDCSTGFDLYYKLNPVDKDYLYTMATQILFGHRKRS